MRRNDQVRFPLAFLTIVKCILLFYAFPNLDWKSFWGFIYRHLVWSNPNSRILSTTENMEAEIMQVILDEARESYAKEIVHEVPSNTVEDMDNNVNRVDQWNKQWLQDKGYD